MRHIQTQYNLLKFEMERDRGEARNKNEISLLGVCWFGVIGTMAAKVF